MLNLLLLFIFSLVFDKRNINPSDPKQGWDGKYKGVLTEPGLYSYKIRVVLLSGEVKVFSGGVRLVR